MLNVLIADNQLLTREGIAAVLSAEEDIQICGQASTIHQLEQMLKTLGPDVVIVDHHYHSDFSIGSIAGIKKQFDFVHILIISNRNNKDEIQELMNIGIKNYVFKECNRDEIIKAVRAAARGEQFYCESISQTLFVSPPSPRPEFNQLSVRETEIVRLVADGMTNKAIAEKLFLSIHTVRTHRKNIIKKLGFTFKNATELISVTGI